MAANNLRWVKSYMIKIFKAQFQFKIPVISQLLGMILEDTLLLFFWYLFFEIRPEILEWKFSNMAFLYSLVTIGFGLSNALFGNCTHISSIIFSGELDYYLTMPTPTLLHLLISRTSLSAWGDVLFGILTFLLIVPFSAINLLIFFIGSIISMLTFVSFAVLTGSVSFFIPNGEQISRQTMGVFFGLAMYPIDVFPHWVKILMFGLLPSAYLGAAQVKATFSPSTLLYTLIFVVPIFLLVISIWVFSVGLKKYESGSHPIQRF